MRRGGGGAKRLNEFLLIACQNHNTRIQIYIEETMNTNYRMFSKNREIFPSPPTYEVSRLTCGHLNRQ